MKVDVYAAYNHINVRDAKDKVLIVLDVLRASSTMITALSNGCKQIIPVAAAEDAMDMARKIDPDNLLLGGERNAKIIPGFHLGNSPFEYTAEAVRGKIIIFTTSNGTNAIRMIAGTAATFIGSVINAAAVAKSVCALGEDVIILCAGTKERFSLDDTLAAGCIISKIKAIHSDIELDDLGQICLEKYGGSASNLVKAASPAAHVKVLNELGFDKDIVYCLTEDIYDIVPKYKDGIVLL